MSKNTRFIKFPLNKPFYHVRVKRWKSTKLDPKVGLPIIPNSFLFNSANQELMPKLSFQSYKIQMLLLFATEAILLLALLREIFNSTHLHKKWAKTVIFLRLFIDNSSIRHLKFKCFKNLNRLICKHVNLLAITYLLLCQLEAFHKDAIPSWYHGLSWREKHDFRHCSYLTFCTVILDVTILYIFFLNSHVKQIEPKHSLLAFVTSRIDPHNIWRSIYLPYTLHSKQHSI